MANKLPNGCLGAFLRLFMGGSTSTNHNAPDGNTIDHKSTDGNTIDLETLPYRIRDDFLSPAELSFYWVLSTGIGNQATICPKVRLADIFFVARPNENMGFTNRIARKHVDFLLCDPNTLRPLVGIELDDRSHSRSDREARDMFVEKTFQAAGLPLVRFPVQPGYNVQEIASRITPHLSPLSLTTPPPLISDFEMENSAPADISITPPNAPVCPKCGLPMVLRKAGRGAHYGEEFYGCSNYPKCRQIMPAAKI